MTHNGYFLKGLAFGILGGAIVGVLYAPKRGKETRDDIGTKTEELLSKAKEDYKRVLERSKKAFEASIKCLHRIQPAEFQNVEHPKEG